MRKYFNGNLAKRCGAAVWILALIFTVCLSVLALIDVLGSWALVAAGVIAVAMTLVRYRARAS
jgi:hypothetical protein